MKMAFQISLKSKVSEFVRVYDDPIQLCRPYTMALKSFVAYNNIPNIATSLENNKITFRNDEKNVTLKIPSGYYDIESLIKTILHVVSNSKDIEKCNLEMSFVKEKLAVKIKCNWEIDFTGPCSVGWNLGFNIRVLEKDTYVLSDRLVNLSNVNDIKIKCNLIKCNVDDVHLYDNTIYEFPFDHEFGTKIIENPTVLSYYPINTDTITNLHIKIVDEENNLFNFRGEHIKIVLQLQPL